MTTSDSDTLRRSNQQRIDALRDHVIVRRKSNHDDTADEFDREVIAGEDYRRDDDEPLDEDTDTHSGLGY